MAAAAVQPFSVAASTTSIKEERRVERETMDGRKVGTGEEYGRVQLNGKKDDDDVEDDV